MQTYEEHKDVEAGSPSASPLVGQGTAGRNSSSEGEEEEEDNLAPLRGETVLGSPRASPEQTGHASLNRLGSLMREGLPDDMKGLLVAFKVSKAQKLYCVSLAFPDDGNTAKMFPPSPSLHQNLTYTVRAKRSELTLLDNVTGFFKPGEMTALVRPWPCTCRPGKHSSRFAFEAVAALLRLLVLLSPLLSSPPMHTLLPRESFAHGQVGPSGSGKTTLLDVLAGRKTAGKIKGNIMYGNEEPTKAFLRRHTGYVEQFGELTEAWKCTKQSVKGRHEGILPIAV